ncbi:positive regulator of sigma E activity [Dysgonomonadaceae bacterium PH5-43]|nr:positive regulator of sigma E activity [Dysgonomonadaceae bacterium PH5-43]
MSNTITHSGKVKEINTDYIKISIQQSTACAECHAKSACNVSDTKEKEIDVPNIYPSIKTGDNVTVMISTSLGLKAVMYSFAIPLFLVFGSLILSVSFINNEYVSAIIALLVLAVYYFTLWLSRNLFKKKFVFTLKLND